MKSMKLIETGRKSLKTKWRQEQKYQNEMETKKMFQNRKEKRRKGTKIKWKQEGKVSE